MAIASYEVVGSGVSGASNTMASLLAATKPRNPVLSVFKPLCPNSNPGVS
jgi:hypothetical protein